MIALLRGQGLCALFSAVVNVVLLSISTDDLWGVFGVHFGGFQNPQNSVAFSCFSLTILLHLAAFLALAGVTKTAFYKHYAAAPAPAQVRLPYHDSSAALSSVELVVSSQEEERPLLGPATDPHPINLTSVAWSIRVELVTILKLAARRQSLKMLSFTILEHR